MLDLRVHVQLLSLFPLCFTVLFAGVKLNIVDLQPLLSKGQDCANKKSGGRFPTKPGAVRRSGHLLHEIRTALAKRTSHSLLQVTKQGNLHVRRASFLIFHRAVRQIALCSALHFSLSKFAEHPVATPHIFLTSTSISRVLFVT